MAPISNGTAAKFDTIYSLPMAPTRRGYRFVGWKLLDPEDLWESGTDPYNGRELAGAEYGVAHKDELGKTVRDWYDFEDGQLVSAADGIASGDWVYAPRTAYRNLAFTEGTDFTFEAVWAVIPYEVELELNREVGSTSVAFDSSTLPLPRTQSTIAEPNGRFGREDTVWHTFYTVEGPVVNVADPQRVGYTFLGWDGGDTSEPVRGLTIPVGSTGERSYSARWEPISYSITYVSDKGSAYGMPDDTQLFYDGAGYISEQVPVLRGYTFDGWDIDGTTYAPGESVLNMTSVDGHEFVAHAKWTPVPYTLTFNLWDAAAGAGNGSTYATRPSGVTNEQASYEVGYNVESDAISVYEPVREGYKFLGWRKGAEAPVHDLVIPTGSIGNATYDAEWSPISYTLHFVSAGTPLLMPEDLPCT